MRWDILFFAILLIVIVWICFKNFWRVNLIFNKSVLENFTDDELFPLGAEYRDDYNRFVQKGLVHARNKRIVICSLVRDVEAEMQNIVRKCSSVTKFFKDYAIVIVENNSDDQTRKMLIDWHKLNPKVTVLGCGVNNPDYCDIPTAKVKTVAHGTDFNRINKMAYLRNIYLDYVKDNLRHFDYIFMWDLDILGSVYIDGILHSIGKLEDNKDINLMCAYGIRNIGMFSVYYDSYAHVGVDEEYVHSRRNEHSINNRLQLLNLDRGSELIECKSCFGGFAIYRISEIISKNLRYTQPGNELECEHLTLNKGITGKYVNPSMINLVVLNE